MGFRSPCVFRAGILMFGSVTIHIPLALIIISSTQQTMRHATVS